jgi:hypothetical protein
MKRSLFLAVSVIALTAVSDQLWAAGAETPAPSEQAAPARRAAPQRARPAPTPQRQAAQSQSSSFTGTQAGGFGGGNAGGGGFADPTYCGTGLGFDPRCGSATQNIGKNTGALGGLELGQMFPAGYWLWGWAVDAQGSTLRSEGNQNGIRFVPFTLATVNEGFTTSQTQPFMTTARLKLGGIVAPGTAIYVTGGASGVYVHGDFNYQAYNVGSPGLFSASGTSSYDKFRLGYALGGGVTFSIPGSPVGFTIEYLYTDEGTVNQAIPVTCTGTVVCGGSFASGIATTSMKTQASAIRAKFSQGF